MSSIWNAPIPRYWDISMPLQISSLYTPRRGVPADEYATANLPEDPSYTNPRPFNFTRKAERVSQRQKRLLTYCCWRVMLYYAEIFVRKEVKWRFPIRLAGTVRGVVGAVLDLFRSPYIDEFDFVVVVKVNKTVYLQLVSVFFRLFFVFFFLYLNTPVWDRSRNAHRLLPSSLFP